MINSDIIHMTPDYIWQGLFHVLVLGVSTLVVAIVTSWVFKRKDEVTRVEGVLLEKKLDLYRQLSDKLLAFESLHQFSEAEIAMAKHLIGESGLEMPKFYHAPSFMVEGADKMYDQLMEFDKFATENKMYYDDYTAWPIFVFLNYKNLFVRFHAMFRDEIFGMGYKMTDKVKTVEGDMFRAIGLIVCAEWGERVEDVLQSLQESVNNLSLKHRKKPLYDYQTIQDPNGPMMQSFQNSELIKNNDKITHLITSYVALGLVAAGMKEKDLRKLRK